VYFAAATYYECTAIYRIYISYCVHALRALHVWAFIVQLAALLKVQAVTFSLVMLHISALYAHCHMLSRLTAIYKAAGTQSRVVQWHRVYAHGCTLLSCTNMLPHRIAVAACIAYVTAHIPYMCVHAQQ
jgi:hypothetical protein